MNVSVIGLGKLGLPLATWLAVERRHNVVAYDASEERRQAVRAWLDGGPCPIAEPGLDIRRDLESRPVLFEVSDVPYAMDVTMIVVPTPSTERGDFDNSAVLDVLGAIAKQVEGKTVVLVSTVSPGSCDNEIVPFFEEHSGLKNGEDFLFLYSPEFIALGSVMQDLQHPDVVLCGAPPSPADIYKAKGVFKVLYGALNRREDGFPSRWHFMSYKEAELAKLALNCAVTHKICFANAIGQLSEAMGCDGDKVLAAVGDDHRIGSAFLRSGPPYGGPCFPRDGTALHVTVKEYAASMVHYQSLDHVAQFLKGPHWFRGQQMNEARRLIRGNTPPDGKVAILGMTYKPGTDVCDMSAGLLLAAGIEEGREIHWHDHIATPPGQIDEDLGPYEVCAGANTICVMHDTYGNLDWEAIAASMAPDGLIYAPWGVPKKEQLGETKVVYTRGVL